jgi:hypothetical protein
MRLSVAVIRPRAYATPPKKLRNGDERAPGDAVGLHRYRLNSGAGSPRRPSWQASPPRHLVPPCTDCYADAIENVSRTGSNVSRTGPVSGTNRATQCIVVTSTRAGNSSQWALRLKAEPREGGPIWQS